MKRNQLHGFYSEDAGSGGSAYNMETPRIPPLLADIVKTVFLQLMNDF
jgi:hypothetical protein